MARESQFVGRVVPGERVGGAGLVGLSHARVSSQGRQGCQLRIRLNAEWGSHAAVRPPMCRTNYLAQSRLEFRQTVIIHVDEVPVKAPRASVRAADLIKRLSCYMFFVSFVVISPSLSLVLLDVLRGGLGAGIVGLSGLRGLYERLSMTLGMLVRRLTPRSFGGILRTNSRNYRSSR